MSSNLPINDEAKSSMFPFPFPYQLCLLEDILTDYINEVDLIVGVRYRKEELLIRDR